MPRSSRGLILASFERFERRGERVLRLVVLWVAFGRDHPDSGGVLYQTEGVEFGDPGRDLTGNIRRIQAVLLRDLPPQLFDAGVSVAQMPQNSRGRVQMV